MPSALETAAAKATQKPSAKPDAAKKPDLQQLHAALMAANRHVAELRTKHAEQTERMDKEAREAERAAQRAHDAYHAARRG